MKQKHSFWKKSALLVALSVAVFTHAGAAHAESKYTATDKDTFWTMSQKFGVSLEQLLKANPMVDPSNVYKGLTIVIPTTVSVANLKQDAPQPIAQDAKQKQAAGETAKPEAAAKALVKAEKAEKTANAAEPKKAPQAEPAKKATKKAASKKSSTKSSAAKRQAKQNEITVGGKEYGISDVVKVKASAYTADPSENGWGAVDYFGNPLKLGTIAVDPNVIPLGSKLYITGYDHDGLPVGGMIGIASDMGSAIKGERIDIFVPQSKADASDFGFQSVKVFVLN
ncbi:3D (Asp-Asp-Asp) domain-containing protein [Paenibacillus taihuensis]|uniref:3D (Asp-Asp-Asp) domain-containing protein n=1 Tax=Paenibacillus taihuensis TaxID=1156355 RepID=A0A3D9SE39_9BACL|nr:3D domain-containing protein [Paenibacillus taihuensis]REE92857.1 3D (Asp-Asp-Asp) domain-containing protein [Paenibacillus taihuensis]